MSFSPLGAYREGRGPLHRLRPGAKLLGLFAFATVTVAWRGPITAAAALGIGIALAVVAGLRGRDIGRVLRRFALIGVPLLLFTAASRAFSLDPAAEGAFLPSAAAWAAGAEHAFGVIGSLLALILAASAVTASTRVDDMLDTITWLLRPLRPLGVDPERVAFAFSLVITAIPNILGIARETRTAARARGLGRDPRALLVPFVLRTVSHAQLTGQALAARGIGDPGPEHGPG